MSSLVENNVVEFRTTFQSVLDQDGFLINQDDLVCRETTDLSLMVIRTSKDHKKMLLLLKTFLMQSYLNLYLQASMITVIIFYG